jgi:DNA-binding NarL/FixJ family response regulator
MSHKIRVVILDDHPLFVEGYFTRLANCPGIEVTGTAYDGETLEKVLAENQVDIVLMDVKVPVREGSDEPYPILAVIPNLLQTYPDLEVLVVSMHDQPTLIRSILEAGASGYVLKEDRHFLDALPDVINLVANGGMYMSPLARQKYFKQSPQGPQLTPRQLQALSLCAAYPDANTAQLAEKMRVAGSTIRNLLSNAYISLEVHSRVAAVAKAQSLGLITPGNSSFNLSELRKI